MTNRTHTQGVSMGPIMHAFRRPALLAATLALFGAGCESLVEYEEKDIVTADAVSGPSGATALVANARNSFTLAMNGDGDGGTEGQILISGLLSDEFFHSGTFSTRVDVDQRATAIDNGTQAGAFRRLQAGRTDPLKALEALATVTTITPATDSRFGEMNNYIGAVFLTAAQNFCSGIPFSGFVAGELIAGDQLTTQQMIDSAIVYFDKALAGAAGTGNAVHNFARLQKARALTMIGRNRLAEAATLVAAVPTTYRHLSFHAETPSSLRNGIFVFNVQNERWSVAHKDGGNGLPFRGASATGTDAAQADPRVPWRRLAGNVGFDNNTPQYDLQIYTTRTDASVFLKGQEARLIEAEAKLEAGNAAGWLADLNALRATVTGLAPLTDPGNATDRVKLHFTERAFWLFATGTRVMDLRRMTRQYSIPAETIWPTGSFFKGGSYGPDVNLPVPDTERNNPKYAKGISCINRSA